MTAELPPLYLPVETAARELDAKLLLALFAVEAGLPVVLGNRAAMNLAIHRFAPGVYLSHNFDRGRRRILEIVDRLGHRVVAWDEEGFVWLDPASYRRRRVATRTLRHIDTIFAWGADHVAALDPVTGPMPVEIVALGNPRADLLGPRFRKLYEERAGRLRAELGPFILINSNFGWLNYALGRGDPVARSARELAAIAQKSRHPEGYIRHKYAIFRAFVALLPSLARTYGDRTIVVRPHPSEDHGAWVRAAEGLDNVVVRFDDELVAWLLAADVMVHNACTTAVESALLGRASIMYRPIDGGPFEPPQPLAVSIEASTEAELFQAIDAADRHAGLPRQVQASLERYVAGLHDGLAAERIADAVAALAGRRKKNNAANRGLGVLQSRLRGLEKSLRRYSAASPSNPAYIAQKFPPMTVGELTGRAGRLAQFLDMPVPAIAEVGDRIFTLDKAAPAGPAYEPD
ncbi:MAG: hypothetical protein O7A03_01950 [Alphaproteobacteria bacterium]|nr:hypothetical protein [Alphaproteobacteria bacterium]